MRTPEGKTVHEKNMYAKENQENDYTEKRFIRMKSCKNGRLNNNVRVRTPLPSHDLLHYVPPFIVCVCHFLSDSSFQRKHTLMTTIMVMMMIKTT